MILYSYGTALKMGIPVLLFRADTEDGRRYERYWSMTEDKDTLKRLKNNFRARARRKLR